MFAAWHLRLISRHIQLCSIVTCPRCLLAGQCFTRLKAMVIIEHDWQLRTYSPGSPPVSGSMSSHLRRSSTSHANMHAAAMTGWTACWSALACQMLLDAVHSVILGPSCLYHWQHIQSTPKKRTHHSCSGPAGSDMPVPPNKGQNPEPSSPVVAPQILARPPGNLLSPEPSRLVIRRSHQASC